MPQFANMTPWGILAPNQFLPAGPPALGSPQYLMDYDEVRLMGSATSPLRTADETDACRFWESGSPTHFWNRAAIDLSAGCDARLSENAHLLATLNLAIADAVIACWNSKYTYEFWRPVTAIRLTDDPDWTPLCQPRRIRSTPRAIRCASSAAATVLADYFGDDTLFCSSRRRRRVGFGSIRASPRRSTRSPMPACSPGFISGPPAKMAESSVAMWPALSWKIGCSASTEKGNSRARLAARENE